MKRQLKSLNLAVAALISLSLFGGCATAPFGPTVQCMPEPGKPFDLFQQEQKECQDYAFQSMGGQAAVDRANANAVGQGVLGTLIGAAAGAVTGAAFGDAGVGAGIGAGAGMVGGAGAGANSAANSNAQLQLLYDNAYEQCMYAKGNQVPSATHHRRKKNRY
jgi:hypothetical protein